MVKVDAPEQQRQLPPMEIFLDLDRSGPVPLYHQVAERLERAILDETIPAGSRLENEVDLAARLSVSRPTIRRAIEQLVGKGLLVRRRGIGTQVVHGRVTRNVELTSLYEDLQRTGQHPETRVLGHELSPADEEEATALGIAVGDTVLRVQRLRDADGVPIAIMENILPPTFADLERSSLEEHGLYQILRARGVSIRVAKQRIGARAGTAKECSLLGIARGSAVLTMQRTAFDSAGQAIEFGRHCYRPDLYSFEVTLVER